VLSAPSGAGKTTLARILLQRVELLTQTVSWTTREPRPGEVDGADYTFVESAAFEAHEKAGGFLESALVHGCHYGTPASEIERILGKGHDALLVIDVQGAESVRSELAAAVTIFVLPPSRPVLEERLAGRDGADPANRETIRRRLGVAAEEIAQFVRYDYVVINDDFDRAVGELEAIVRAERCRTGHRTVEAEGMEEECSTIATTCSLKLPRSVVRN
jgi:guanylate kinase